MDLFFVLAWDILRALHGLKKVEINLSGCIKNSAHRYWKGKLNSSCAEDTVLVKETWKKARKDMQTRGIEAMFHCECTYLCAVRTAAGANSAFADNDDVTLRSIEGLQNILDTAYWDFED